MAASLPRSTAPQGGSPRERSLALLTKLWVVPKQTLTLAPFDEIMTPDCNAGDTKALIEAATPDASKK